MWRHWNLNGIALYEKTAQPYKHFNCVTVEHKSWFLSPTCHEWQFSVSCNNCRNLVAIHMAVTQTAWSREASHDSTFLYESTFSNPAFHTLCSYVAMFSIYIWKPPKMFLIFCIYKAQLICQGLTYLPIWTAFVAFPICRHRGKKLSMMAFVKCDKSKATVVFQR